MMRVRILSVVAVATACVLLSYVASAQTSTQAERAVRDTLDDERDLRGLDVSVVGSEATLSGQVPHLYAKNLAIERALAVDGIETVASEIELPEPEDDAQIVERVSEVINGYAFYTLWDYLDGSVNQGVVTLFGKVTPDRDKKRELYEDIARIRGVQDYVDNIEILSPSTEDERLRRVIANQVFRSEHFQRFATMTTPPFHIIVDRSVVTLVGYVQSEIEYREMERIIVQTGRVLRVDNQLVVLR